MTQTGHKEARPLQLHTQRYAAVTRDTGSARGKLLFTARHDSKRRPLDQ